MSLPSRTSAPVAEDAPPTVLTPRPSIAVVCDFVEENWPSMDLNGEMLYHSLAKDHASEIAVTQVRPAFQRRFIRLPLFPQSFAWNADRLMNRFVDYPRTLSSQCGHFDLFHLVDHSYAQLLHYLPPGRSIVTCHDLDTFRCVLEPQLEKRPRWFQAMASRILAGFRQAAHVICNSNATRDQLLHYNLFPSDKITVIHSGVHPAFGATPQPAAESEAARLLQSDFSKDDIRLLSVGSTIPRKRMDVLLRVFAGVLAKFPKARLVRVGGPFTEAQQALARELGVEGAVMELPFISRDVLASIYRRVAVLLQPSEAEGFGMPIAEAMACGCPVVASDLPALREVGGAACVYCPVGDIEAWKRAVLLLLEQNLEPEGISFQLREQAQAQVSRYSWSENARRTVGVYRQVLGFED